MCLILLIINCYQYLYIFFMSNEINILKTKQAWYLQQYLFVIWNNANLFKGLLKSHFKVKEGIQFIIVTLNLLITVIITYINFHIFGSGISSWTETNSVGPQQTYFMLFLIQQRNWCMEGKEWMSCILSSYLSYCNFILLVFTNYRDNWC